mgnify:CR=1 FL=1
MSNAERNQHIILWDKKENWRNFIKKIKEGVILELEGDSVLIESFVLKEEVIKKLKQFKSKVREMHYVFVLTTEPLYVTVIKCEKKNINI